MDATEIPEQTNVQRVAHLLGVPVQSLIDALTRKTIFAHGETVVSILYNTYAHIHTQHITHAYMYTYIDCKDAIVNILYYRN